MSFYLLLVCYNPHTSTFYFHYYLNVTVLIDMCAVLSTGIYQLYTVSRCLNDSSEI